MNTKFSSSLSDKQGPHCKYIISQAVTKVQQIPKKKKVISLHREFLSKNKFIRLKGFGKLYHC